MSNILYRFCCVLSCLCVFSVVKAQDRFVLSSTSCETLYPSFLITPTLTSDQLEQIKDTYLMEDGEEQVAFWAEYELAQMTLHDERLAELLYESGLRYRNSDLLLGAMSYFLINHQIDRAYQSVQKALQFNKDTKNNQLIRYYEAGLSVLKQPHKGEEKSRLLYRLVKTGQVLNRDVMNLALVWLHAAPSKVRYQMYVRLLKEREQVPVEAFLLQACMAYQIDKPRLAYQLASNVAYHSPEDTSGLILMLMFMDITQTDDTLALVEDRLSSSDVLDSDVLLYYLDLLQSNGYDQKALDFLESVWDRYGADSYQFWLIKSRLYMRLNQYDKAKALLQDYLLARDYVFAEALNRYESYYDEVVLALMDIYEYQHDYTSAFSLLKTYAIEKPSNILFILENKARLYADLGQNDKVFEQLLYLNDVSVQDPLAIAVTRVRISDYLTDLNQRLDILRQALKSYPKELWFRQRLFKIYKQQKQYKEAERLLEEAIALGQKDIDVYFELAKIKWELGDNPKLISQLFKKAFALAPERLDLLSQMMRFYHQQQAYQEVMKYGARVYRIDPSDKSNLMYADVLLFHHHNTLAKNVLLDYALYHPNDKQFFAILEKYQIILSEW